MIDRVTAQMKVLRQMALQGYNLFPLKKMTKLPLHKGYQDIKYSALDIEVYIRQGNNVGVLIQRGQLVIDTDPRNGGLDSAWLLGRMADIPKSPKVISGRGDGGNHRYFKYDKLRYPYLRRSIPDLPGIDFMTSGHVVAPLGLHMASGKPYALEGDKFFPVPTIPDDILDLYKAAAPKQATSRSGRVPPEALAALLRTLDARDYGPGKHDTWFDLMCSCHDATAGSGIEEFLEWCATDPTYADAAAQAQTRTRWLSLTDKDMRKTYLTLFRAVIDSGNRDVLLAVEKAYDFDEKPDDPAHDFDEYIGGDDE